MTCSKCGRPGTVRGITPHGERVYCDACLAPLIPLIAEAKRPKGKAAKDHRNWNEKRETMGLEGEIAFARRYPRFAVRLSSRPNTDLGVDFETEHGAVDVKTSSVPDVLMIPAVVNLVKRKTQIWVLVSLARVPPIVGFARRPIVLATVPEPYRKHDGEIVMTRMIRTLEPLEELDKLFAANEPLSVNDIRW